MINPLRLNIPGQITTERLQLRAPRVGDGEIIVETILASLPELKPWMPWATDEYTVNDAEDWCCRAAAKLILREDASYLIFQRNTSRYLGNITSFSKDWKVPKFEIGYWMASSDTGHGYMTEALLAVTAMTFESIKARRIEVHTDAENHRSRRVAERAGYLLEGIMRNDCREANGELRDSCLYAQVR